MAKAPTAKRYAEALFALAEQKNATEAWLDDLREVARALAEPTMRTYLTTPRVRIEDKLRAVAEVTRGRDPMIANLVGLLTGRHGTALLDKIADEYSELLNQSLGQVRAEVTAAVPVSAEQQRRLRNTLGSALEKEVMLETREDPEIIGGLIVRVGDQIIDGSVRSRLAALKQRLAHESLT